ncbi:hypothetical protein TVAG_107340 [Trichomonas vaginalis G3]|uniref:Uncharacterized protein n=1 Tax=Trichomonas vaginalis (strain ATCC PRA-98 / G3) TaxID=412133 RepID=A2FSB3_TRIV3|nr:helicase protein [Trichomonas vaginalis G3]EAX92200.1 hypothetical protein TVAG_107340 [Trichomonas vaginalis G3]KAI5544000.1 helicase protein [Trichomonas vaginalis G3]|eukprot:XP_001305130.1 hypothetical protein [Trichomonas vaginalis G3]
MRRRSEDSDSKEDTVQEVYNDCYIVMSRIRQNVEQYLVKDYDNGISQWKTIDELKVMKDYKNIISLFKKTEIKETNLREEEKPVAISFRPDKYLLYRVFYDYLYWEKVSDDEFENFVSNMKSFTYKNDKITLNLQESNELLQKFVNINNENRSGILYDSLSTQKYNLVTRFLNTATDNGCGPFLVVTTKENYSNWYNFLENTKLVTIDYSCDPLERNIIRDYCFNSLDEFGSPYQNKFSFNVIVTTYGILKYDLNSFENIPFHTVIYDEPTFSEEIDFHIFPRAFFCLKYLELEKNSTYKSLLSLVNAPSEISSVDFSNNFVISIKQTVANRNHNEIVSLKPTNSQDDCLRMHHLDLLQKITNRYSSKSPEAIEQEILNNPTQLLGLNEYYSKIFKSNDDFLLKLSSKFQFIKYLVKTVYSAQSILIVTSNYQNMQSLYLLFNQYSKCFKINGKTNIEKLQKTFKDQRQERFIIIYQYSSQEIDLSFVSVIIYLEPQENYQDINIKVNIYNSLEEIHIYHLICTDFEKTQLLEQIKRREEKENYLSVRTVSYLLENTQNLSFPLIESISDYNSSNPDDIKCRELKYDESETDFIARMTFNVQTDEDEKLMSVDESYLCVYFLDLLGFGQWKQIGLSIKASVPQVKDLCMSLINYCLSKLSDTQISDLPHLLAVLSKLSPTFSLENIHTIEIDFRLLRLARHAFNSLWINEYRFLKTIELRLCARKFLKRQISVQFDIKKDLEDFGKFGKVDRNVYTPLSDFKIANFEPSQIEIAAMGDLIYGNHIDPLSPMQQYLEEMMNRQFLENDEIIFHMKWNSSELYKLFTALKNFPNDENFYSKAAIVTKTKADIKNKIDEIMAKSSKNKDKEAIIKYQNLFSLMKEFIKANPPQNNIIEWTNSTISKFFELVMIFGLNRFREILLDSRFKFVNLLSQEEILLLRKRSRNIPNSTHSSFLTVRGIMDFLGLKN